MYVIKWRAYLWSNFPHYNRYNTRNHWLRSRLLPSPSPSHCEKFHGLAVWDIQKSATMDHKTHPLAMIEILRTASPETGGFSPTQLKNMRQSKLEISNRSENTKYLSCHHLDLDFCLLILSSHHPNRNRFWPTWTTLPNIRFSVLRISRHWVAPVAIITASFLLQRSPQLLLEFLPEFSSDTPVASYCPLWKLRPKATIVLGKN